MPCSLLQPLEALLIERLPICFPWQPDHFTVPPALQWMDSRRSHDEEVCSHTAGLQLCLPLFSICCWLAGPITYWLRATKLLPSNSSASRHYGPAGTCMHQADSAGGCGKNWFDGPFSCLWPLAFLVFSPVSAFNANKGKKMSHPIIDSLFHLEGL